jgi:hypothetical protein
LNWQQLTPGSFGGKEKIRTCLSKQLVRQSQSVTKKALHDRSLLPI